MSYNLTVLPMKTSIVLSLACLFCVSGHAQVFRPETINGAIIGGVAGAVIGNNSGDLHHNGARGAVIGAAAGALIGSAVGENREHADYRGTHAAYRGDFPARSSLSVGVGYRSGGYWGSPYRHSVGYAYPAHRYGARYGYSVGYYAPVYPSYYYGYDDDYYGPSRAASGAVLGGIAGAIIGNNSGHRNGLQGAAIGAGAGLLLGALADDTERGRVVESVPVYREDAAPAQAPAPAPVAAAPQNVTVINNYYGSNPAPMASANGLFGR